LIEAGLKEDSEKVFNYTSLLIQKIEGKGDIQAANQLKNILKRKRSISLKPNEYGQTINFPVDLDSRIPLGEIMYFEDSSVFLKLPRNEMSIIEEYIFLINNLELFIARGVKTHRSMLLFGKPGTGKTQTARYISSRVKLPLVVVRLDGLISSYLGNTSKNIRAIFEFVERTPCILFLDEIDAIAKMRDDSNELGELKRVVNTLLQNIDSVESKVPIIAATNHEHLLDPAVWRRFDYKVKVELPSQELRKQLIMEFLKDIVPNVEIIEILSYLTEGMTGSDIESFSTKIKTYLILDQKQTLCTIDIFDYFIRFLHGSEQNVNNEGNSVEELKLKVAKFLREQNRKEFTIRKLSRITGLSTGKISQELRKEVVTVG
jgi:ATP-dependent Clp protease ATP-binding subunit ClpA